MHGTPVHFGDPAASGSRTSRRPDFGDAVEIRPGEVPVFWACGVTPQAVAMACRPPLMITHAPGHMFVTDRRDAEFDTEEQCHDRSDELRDRRTSRPMPHMRRRCVRAISGAAIGNAVEWFDFAVYGFLATYIAGHFFPSEDETASLLKNSWYSRRHSSCGRSADTSSGRSQTASGGRRCSRWSSC